MSRRNSEHGSAGVSNSEFFMIVGAIVVLFFVYAYHNHYEYFAFVWKLKRHAEVFVLQFVPAGLQDYTGLQFDAVKKFLDSTPSAEIKRETVAFIDNSYFYWVKYLVAVFILFLAFRLRSFDDGLGVGSNPRDYLEKVASTNPNAAHSKPYVEYSPTSESIHYDPKKSPNDNYTASSMQLHEFITAMPPVGVPSAKRPICKGRKWEDMDIDLAEKVFSLQLGGESGVFRGVDSLSPIEKRIFTDCYKALPAKYRKKIVTNLQNIHYYKLTFLRGLLEQAWKFKVMPVLLYRYELKRQNRVLYYTLNAAASGNCSIECGGVISHYLMESSVSRKIKEPMIDLAMMRLKEAVDDLASGVHENEADPNVAKELKDKV